MEAPFHRQNIVCSIYCYRQKLSRNVATNLAGEDEEINQAFVIQRRCLPGLVGSNQRWARSLSTSTWNSPPSAVPVRAIPYYILCIKNQNQNIKHLNLMLVIICQTIAIMSLFVLWLLVAPAIAAKSSTSPPITTSSSGNVKPLQFSSAIQSYTIFDKSAITSPGYASPRRKFLPRFRTGLAAERRARELILEEERRGLIHDDNTSSSGGSWAEASAAADEKKKRAIEKTLQKYLSLAQPSLI